MLPRGRERGGGKRERRGEEEEGKRREAGRERKPHPMEAPLPPSLLMGLHETLQVTEGRKLKASKRNCYNPSPIHHHDRAPASQSKGLPGRTKANKDVSGYH